MSMLRKAKLSDIPVLLAFLNTKLPSSISIIALLHMEENFKISREIYVPKDDPTKFIFAKNIIDNWPSFNVFWDPNRVSDAELKEFLSSVKDWKWNMKFSLCCADADLAIKLDSVIMNDGLSTVYLKRTFSGPYHVQKLKEDKIINICLPQRFKYGVLKGGHLPNVFSKWNLSKNYSIENFQNYMKIFPSTAIFKEDDTNYSTPISWIFLNSYGYIANLYTEPEYRRIGLASCVLRYQCSKIIHEKLEAISQIDKENRTSLELHKKLGFEVISSVIWIHYDCTT